MVSGRVRRWRCITVAIVLGGAVDHAHPAAAIVVGGVGVNELSQATVADEESIPFFVLGDFGGGPQSMQGKSVTRVYNNNIYSSIFCAVRTRGVRRTYHMDPPLLPKVGIQKTCSIAARFPDVLQPLQLGFYLFTRMG